MNPEDNIKNFFQSRLNAGTSESEDWNTPSDDIWENAKIDFPKEDKSRKPFLFILFGLLGLVVIGLLGYTQIDKTQDQQLTERNISLENNKSQIISNQETKTNRIEESKSSIEKSSLIKTEKGETHFSNNSINDKELVVNPNNIVRNSATSQISNSKLASNSNQKTKAPTAISIELESETPNTKNTRPIVENANNTSLSFENTLPPINDIKPTSTKLAESAKEANEESIQNLININQLSSLDTEPLAYNILNSIKADPLITPLKRDKKWEIGISTSPLVLPVARLIKQDSGDDDITNVNLKYVGLNLPITRLLNQKWSITSGLYYKRGNLTAELAAEEVLDVGDNLMFTEESSVASITLEDQTEEVAIKLKPDVTILDGDIISIDGLVKFNLNALQIPLLANYHIRKNRFEYIFSLGASVDILNLEISEFDLTLSNQSNIITEPVKFTPLSSRLLEYSIYTGVGTKFHFNETTNLSYTLKADVTGFVFSTHEIGLHYRF